MLYTKRVTGLDFPISRKCNCHSWIHRQLQIVSPPDLEPFGNSSTEHLVKQSIKELSQAELTESAVALDKIVSNVAKIFTSEVEALDILVSPIH